MKRFSYVVGVLAVALLLANAAKADTVDPAIGVKGGGGTIEWPGSTTVAINCQDPDGCTLFSDTFAISSGTITSFFVHSDVPLVFTALFGETVTPSGTPTTDAVLSNFTITPAVTITSLALASICADCTPSPVLISGDFLFEIHAESGTVADLTFSTSPVPEPGTLVLLGTGLGALGLRRLRKRARA